MNKFLKQKCLRLVFGVYQYFLHILIPVFTDINVVFFHNIQRSEVKVSSDYFSWHIHYWGKELKLIQYIQYISINTQNTRKLILQSQQWAISSLYSGISPHDFFGNFVLFTWGDILIRIRGLLVMPKSGEVKWPSVWLDGIPFQEQCCVHNDTNTF